MDNEQFTQLSYKIRDLTPPLLEYIFDSHNKKKTTRYATENDNLSFIFEETSITENKFFSGKYTVKVHQEGKHLADINFYNTSHLYPEYKNSDIVMNGNKITETALIEEFLNSINFDTFIKKEFKNVDQKIAQQKQKELEAQKAADIIINELVDNMVANRPQDNSSHLKSIYKKLDVINSSQALTSVYVDTDYLRLPLVPTVKINSTFENFNVSHTLEKWMVGNYYIVNSINFVDSDKNIDFTLEVTANMDVMGRFRNDQRLIVGEKSTRDTEIIGRVINNFPIHEYLDQLVKKEQILTQALELQKNISQHTIEASPVIINGAKVWLNSDNQLHREDGPAIENYHGKDFWFNKGTPYLPEGKQEVLNEQGVARIYENGILTNEPTLFSKEGASLLIKKMKDKMFSPSSDNNHTNSM